MTHLKVGDDMKRILFLIAIIIILLSLSACDLNPIINKINGNEASAKAESEEQKYKMLADGTRLYKKSNVSAESEIQFKDEDGNILLDASDILFVSAKWSVYNGYYIELEFTEEGTTDFANATRENIGKKINVAFGEQILSSPTVNEEITVGRAILGNYQGHDELMIIFNKFVK